MRAACHSIAVFATVIVCVASAACSGKPPAPAPPIVTPPSAGETITGAERIGWTERAADAVDLALVKYAIYVDGTRSELSASCDASTFTPDGVVCSAKLPALTTGAHVLELASFIVEGSVLESSRSAALRVTVTGIGVNVGRSASGAAADP